MAVVLLQETHRTTDDYNLKLPGFLLAGSILSKHHGMATFVRTGITWSAVKQSPPDSNIEWLVTEDQETTVVNVNKPPPSALRPVQDSGEVDTPPHRPCGRPTASSGTSRLPPWSINGGPSNTTNTRHRRQLSEQRTRTRTRSLLLTPIQTVI